MRLVGVAMVVLAVAGGCPAGPVPAPVGPFELLEEGDGDGLLENAPPQDGAVFTFFVESRFETSQVSFEGVVDHGGVLLSRKVTEDEVIYVGHRDDAELFFGTSREGLLDEGVVTLSFPLKAGRRWTAGVPSFPDLFEYTVIGPEVIETPAGLFDAVRVDQLNRRDDTDVARWFAADVGLVHRVGADAEAGGAITATTLIDYSIPETP